MLWSSLLIIRFVIAVILVMVLPGLALHLALFGRAAFNRVERAFLILSFSVALASLTAVALAMTPAGLNPWLFGLTLTAITLLLGVLTVLRFQDGRSFGTTVAAARSAMVPLGRTFLARRTVELSAFLAIMLVLMGAAMLRSETPTGATEFAFPSDQLSRLLTDAANPAPTLEVPVEITNGAPTEQIFRVEVWSNGAKVAGQDGITIAAHATTQTTLRVPAQSDAPAPLEFRLFDASQTTPVAQLRLRRGSITSQAAQNEP